MAIEETSRQGFFSKDGRILTDSLRAPSSKTSTKLTSTDTLTKEAAANQTSTTTLDAVVLDLQSRSVNISGNTSRRVEIDRSTLPKIGGTYQNELIAASKKAQAEAASKSATESKSAQENSALEQPSGGSTPIVAAKEILVKERDQALSEASRQQRDNAALEKVSTVLDKMLTLVNSSKERGPLIKKQEREERFKALRQELGGLVQASEKQGSTALRGLDPKSLDLDKMRLNRGGADKNSAELTKIKEEVAARTSQTTEEQRAAQETAAVLTEALNYLSKS
ncbi:MAG: hypothetical protein GX589_05015 [Deltaproteobacteria bacterium]|nr:hypothetical protein [Deltaproteobacteria bacterium]